MEFSLLAYCVLCIQKADKAKEMGEMYVQIDARVLKRLATELMNKLQEQ